MTGADIIDWREQASCRTTDPALFFPADGPETLEKRRQIAAARRICRFCPVKTECLEFALAHDITDGIFGGLGAGQRRSLRRVS